MSLERDQLVDLVRRIMRGASESQEEADSLVDLFVQSVPHPSADDLIFYPEREFGYEPTPEEVVDRALAYRPIEL